MSASLMSGAVYQVETVSDHFDITAKIEIQVDGTPRVSACRFQMTCPNSSSRGPRYSRDSLNFEGSKGLDREVRRGSSQV